MLHKYFLWLHPVPDQRKHLIGREASKADRSAGRPETYSSHPNTKIFAQVQINPHIIIGVWLFAGLFEMIICTEENFCQLRH